MVLTKLLFDYTPYVTWSDWLRCLANQRWMWENCECRRLQLKQTCSRNELSAKNSEIWKHFKPEEWFRHTRLAETLGFTASGGDASATEQLPTDLGRATEEPYAVLAIGQERHRSQAQGDATHA